MNLRLRINGKMLIYILGLTALIYAGSLGYVSYKLYNVSSDNAKNLAQVVAKEYAFEAQQILDKYIESANSLAKVLSNIQVIQEDVRRDFVMNKLNTVIQDNPDFLSVWSIWEPNTIDGLDSLFINKPGSTYIGSFSPGYYREGNEIKLEENSSTTLFQGQYFKDVKECNCPLLLEPYYYSYSGSDNDSILQTNIVFPIKINNEFVGVIGIDAPLDFFQEKFGSKHPLKDGQIYLLSNKGVVVTSPKQEYINKSLLDLGASFVMTDSIVERIGKGDEFDLIGENEFINEKAHFAFKPLKIKDSDAFWSICISIPVDTIFAQSNKTLSVTIIIGLVGLIIITIVIVIFARSIANPIISITKSLQLLAKGNIRTTGKIKYKLNDEIGDLATAINSLYDGLNSATNFANEIGKGNLQTEYKLLSFNDELGNSLLQMQKSLLVAKDEEEKKKIQDANRNWVTHGLAQFGEIIRQDNDNMERFASNIVNELAKYMEVAQVALFINETDQYEIENSNNFVLKAAIAYGKLVMLEKTVSKGSELVGRAADEDRIIHLKDIPQDYVDISPGMNDKNRPNQLLISPLSVNDITYGIIEILSYNPFLDYHIEFIERLSENIASVISSVKINIQTASLLEQSQHQADELAQHEEEMRQNLEEMQATQEEAANRYADLTSYIKAVKQSMMVAQLDYKGRVIDMSPAMLLAYGFSIESIRGKYFDAFIAQTEELRSEFTGFWVELLNNGSGKRKYKVKQRNKTVHLVEKYKVLKQDGRQDVVLLVAYDITREVELKAQLKKELKAAKK